MGAEWLAILMFAIFLVLLLVGYPVAFSFAGTAIVFGAIGILLGEFDFNRLIILFSRWFKTVDNFTLLAVPSSSSWGRFSRNPGWRSGMLTTIGMRWPAQGRAGPHRCGGGSNAGCGHRRRGGHRYRDGPAVLADHGSLRLRSSTRHRPDQAPPARSPSCCRPPSFSFFSRRSWECRSATCSWER